MNLIHPKHFYTRRNVDVVTLSQHTFNFWCVACTWRGRIKTPGQPMQTSTALQVLEEVQAYAPKEAKVRAAAFVLQQAIILG